MKKTVLLLTILANALTVNAQWNLYSDNFSTGKLRLGTAPTSGKLLYVQFNNTDATAVFENTHASGNGVLISSQYDPLRVGGYNDLTGGLLLVKGDGRVGIGTTSPAVGYKLHVAGNAHVSNNLEIGGNFESFNAEISNYLYAPTGEFMDVYYNSLNHVSDRNFKKDIQEDSYNFQKLYSVKTYTYKFKKDPSERIHFGVMAQDIQEVFPELVTNRGEKGLAVSYVDMIPMLIRAVQDQKQTIDLLQNELNGLRKELNEVQQKNGIIELKDEMILFPNPSSSTTSISFKNTPKTSSAYIEIVNLNGEVIEKVQRTGSQSIQLDNSKLQKGVYFVRYISNGELVETKRMLIEK